MDERINRIYTAFLEDGLKLFKVDGLLYFSRGNDEIKIVLLDTYMDASSNMLTKLANRNM